MKRKVSRLLALTAAAATLAGALTACGNPNASGGGDCKDAKYAIGNMGALSGPNAGLGTVMRDGAKTAIDLYNKKHSDAKVCLVEEDSQGNEKDAPGVAKQLVKNKKVLGVVGPGFSGESMAADPIFDEAGLTIISGSATAPELAEKGWKVFHRTIGNDAVQGPADAKFIEETLKAKKVFVVDDKTAYGAGLSKTLQKALGDKVVGTEHSKTKQTEFGPIISKVKQAKPDVIFYSGYYPEGGPFADQLRKAGVKATFVGPDGLKDENFIKGAGKAHAEGTILTCPCIPGEKAKGTFAKDFKKDIGEAPGTYGAEAFDAANVFLDGINSGIKDRKAMLDYVNKYDKDGASKHIKFDSKGNIEEDVVWTYKVKDGKIVANAPIEMS
ncbi:MAG TPA: branched-chain amino acid ABC transporter substrate-binding protein [Stackebrandtia sp.]|uniref:branched-chain amino acid ABC transporter substrate-binding protein n=1 Tax=Stackebrandtia sp. TaxID=2023065 RepID=UPI002D4B735E|nr:branched-chain amino acid ABC transporter substrate-binding protein [Stackebrandtia sp.]HZE41775.1 branched-chain amino acid ABC transporter substrate-binding protein [Stackebrandtia sp.]